MNKIEMQIFQKKTFDDVLAIRHDLHNLAAFIQNDFERLLNDNIVTKDVIKSEIKEVGPAVEQIQQKLLKLKGDIIEIMKHYSE